MGLGYEFGGGEIGVSSGRGKLRFVCGFFKGFNLVILFSSGEIREDF